MYITLLILKTILFFAGIISIAAGFMMAAYLKAFIDFDKTIDDKYSSVNAGKKKYSFFSNFLYANAKIAGLLLLLLGTSLLYYFVKISLV